MQSVLRLYEDTLSSGSEARLPALPRVVFVVHGALAVGDRGIGGGEAWHGDGAVIMRADKAGATCWRWELTSDAGDGTANGVKHTVHLVIDHAALVRGNTIDGERCEIPGVGPVNVEHARDLVLGDAFLTAVIQKGRDIATVAHLGSTQAAWIFFFSQYPPAPQLLAFSLAAHLVFTLTRAACGVLWLPVAYAELLPQAAAPGLTPSTTVAR